MHEFMNEWMNTWMYQVIKPSQRWLSIRTKSWSCSSKYVLSYSEKQYTAIWLNKTRKQERLKNACFGSNIEPLHAMYSITAMVLNSSSSQIKDRSILVLSEQKDTIRWMYKRRMTWREVLIHVLLQSEGERRDDQKKRKQIRGRSE